MKRSPERERWNDKYRRREANSPPSDIMEETVHLLDGLPGREALDLACGLGRNAIFLARNGFRVDAFDISDVAIERLRRKAARDGLTINPQRCDLETTALGEERYDLILNINYLERRLFPAIQRALAPGGLLIFQTFSVSPTGDFPERMNPAYLLKQSELHTAFDTLAPIEERLQKVERKGEPIWLATLLTRKASNTSQRD